MLSVSAGAGHLRAAEALRVVAQEAGAHAVHLDVMQLMGRPWRRLYVDLYLWLVQRAPALWGWLYRVTDRAAPGGLVRAVCRQMARRASAPLLRHIAQLAPDAIICTHFLPAEVLSALIADGAVRCPVWVQVTDFDLHRMWVHQHMTGYFAANEEVAQRLRAHGVAASAIHVCAIPVMPAFGAAPLRAECARQAGLDPQQRTVLLMGGGAGMGALEQTAANLLRLDGSLQVIAVAGRNAAALAGLQALAKRHPNRLHAVGFTDQIERLMACADLVVTKPGGLTSTECLAMGLPMIVSQPIPGQEQSNADYLLEQGVALKACDPLALAFKVGQLLADPARLGAMRQRALALGRPDAARAVLHTVFDFTTPQPCT